MFFDTPRIADGEIAGGPPTGAGEVFDAARRSSWYVDNVNARSVAMEQAYDQRIDAIFAATGERLPHPMRASPAAGDWQSIADEARTAGKPVYLPDWLDRRFQRQLTELAERHPTRRDVIKPDLPVREDAIALRNAAEKASHDVYARYDGPWGTGALTSFAGSFVGGLSDPVNWAAMMFGPSGRAGVGAKGLLWMGVKQGVANAGVETAFQPAVAAWRREAGISEPALPYTGGTFATNVGTAAIMGFGVDVGVRGTFRGVQALRGRAPKLDDAGGVIGWQSPEAALEDAARRTRDGLLARARDGDTHALKELARETSIDEHPEVRALLHAIDDGEVTATRLPGIDADEDAWRAHQTLLHLLDPSEPRPVAAETIPEARGPSLAERDRLPVQFPDGSPEALGLKEFAQAAQGGMIGPAEAINARAYQALTGRPFERIPRGKVEPRGKVGELQFLIDTGLNYGYRTEDIAAGVVHNYALRTDSSFSAAVNKAAWEHRSFPRFTDKHIEGAYNELRAGPHRLDIEGRRAERIDTNPAGEGRAVVFVDHDGVPTAMGRRTFEGSREAVLLYAGEGWTEAEARRLAARKDLQDGPASVLETAQLLREHPGALDQSISLATADMRQARALARLSDEAFSRVRAGDASPELGALVGDLVPDRDVHGSMLQIIAAAGPTSPADARRMIGALLHQRDTLLGEIRGISDPLGADGRAQMEQLDRQLADDPDQPRRVFEAERQALGDAPEVSLARALDEAEALERMGELIIECRF